MSLLVLVAHDGKTLSLDVAGHTRVDAMQQVLVALTGIAVADQVVMCHGARLAPDKPLAAYKLPAQADASEAEESPVFLYHKAYLRPGAAPPPQEPLPMLEVTVPSLPQLGLRHPLHSAHSPLIRALPDYESQFTQQLGEARAYWETAQARTHRCRQLLAEQEVQARAADAARANVESHYNYIATLYASFVDKYVAQHQAHESLLAQFGELSAVLSSLALPPQLATPQWRVLADLQPRVRLAEWHESCSRSHEHFAQKVVELERVFQLLRGDVERLFLQAPRVDLDALGAALAEVEGGVGDAGAVVAVLGKDLATVRSLVEAVVAQLGSSAGGASLSGAAVHDSCAAVDSLLEQHLHHALPRVRAVDAAAAEFLARCAEAKACMTRDVLGQLQGIAAQQSRIRDMKHKLALLNEVLLRQGAAFAELQAANRLPAAYRLALAECARRGAWREMYAAQAARLAEHCGRITAKEASKREAVNRQLERHLPHDLLAAAGLLQEPPHCTVSLPPSSTFLLPVSPQDVARLPAAIQAAADAAAAAAVAAADSGASSSGVLRRRSGSSDGAVAAQQAIDHASTPRTAAAAGTSAAAASLAALAAVWAQRADGTASVAIVPGGVVGGGGAAAAGAGSAPDMALENARLRAELASVLAAQAARELAEGGAAAGPTAAGGSPGGMASQLLAGPGVSSSSMHSTSGSVALAAASTALPQPPSGSSRADSPAAGAPPSPAQQQQRRYGHGGPVVVPPSVQAPLPSVTAALAQQADAAAAQGSAAAASLEQRALACRPVQAALAAKDALITALEARCSGLSSELAAYEARISALEGQLSATAAASLLGTGGGMSQRRVSGSSGPPRSAAAAEQQAAHRDAVQQQALAAGAGVQSIMPAFVLDNTLEEPPAITVAAAAVDSAGQRTQQAQQQPVAAATHAAPAQEHGSAVPAVSQACAVPAGSSMAAAAPSADTAEAVDTAGSTAAVAVPEAAGHTNAAAKRAGTPDGTASAAAAATVEQGAAVTVTGVLASPHAVATASVVGGPLSVSEPDLRGVLVAGPAEVEAAHTREARSSSLPHRASLDSSAAAAAAAGGLTGLVSSSMQYLFHRSSGSGSNSKAGSGRVTPGSGGATAAASPEAGSP